LESEDLAFFERVRAGYERRWRQAPQRMRRIEAQGGREAVWQRVRAQLQAWQASEAGG
jgi:dTMP kinase